MQHLEETLRLQRLFAVGHTAFVLTLFSPLLFLALVVGLNMDVLYFVGRPFLLLLAVVATALVTPLLHMCQRPKSLMLQATVWVPTLALLAAALCYTVRLYQVKVALETRECLASPEKRSLNMAYQAANEFYSMCQSLMGDQSSTPQEVESVIFCPDYDITSSEWEGQFSYLESLEARFPCSGVCYSGRRLWYDPGTLAPPCSPFVLQNIRTAFVNAKILLICSILLLVVLVPSHLYLLNPTIQHYKQHDAAITDKVLQNHQASMDDMDLQRSA